jgi:hypothetical protein
MSKAKEQAEKFFKACREAGFTIHAGASIVSISKQFAAGDKDAFSSADMDAFSLLALAPMKGGSVWGTDGGSVGGYSGLMKGQYILNKSGSGTYFLNALRKIMLANT